MGADGMEAIELERDTEPVLGRVVRRTCLVTGCGCTEGRIVSPRRARFHAYLARARGETADRFITADPEWLLPTPSDLEA